MIAGFLALDHFATLDEQLLLGAATWLILLVSVAPLSREDRARALLVVVVASCAEVLGSIVLGAYTYRLDNLPAFVPPGTDSSTWPDSGSASRSRSGATLARSSAQ